MEDLYNTVSGSHRGVAYATIIIFGAFVFLMLQTQLFYKGKITDVLRKTSFFSAMLLTVQGVLGVFMAVYSPHFAQVSQTGDYYSHFQYALLILISAGIVARIHIYLKKNQAVSTGIFVLSLLAALIFEYAFPWSQFIQF